MSDQNEGTRAPRLWEALVPVVFLIIALSINVFIFGDDGLSGSSQMVLVFSTGVAVIMAKRLGFTWETVSQGLVSSIGSAMPSILILLMIGALAGTWLISGIVPAMIYYGLKILNPTIFLFAAALISALVSVATGSSWSTIATVGIALLGIGKAMGIPEGIIAGSIISGAYFGDKMSPLSDTTNLAPAVAGTDLFTHIRYMTITTVPSISVALIVYLVMGFVMEREESVVSVDEVLLAIDHSFNISAWLFIVPILVVIMIIKKVPALPALFAGALLGGFVALVAQPHIISDLSGVQGDPWRSGYITVMKAMYGDISIVTENAMVNDLLSSSGMAGMLKTIWLIVVAMAFGGVMETTGMLHKITSQIVKRVETVGGLIASTTGTCIFFNITTSDQYLAIVVPGKMYSEAYQARGLAPENLSRTLEDSATVTSVLVPWNTCGATQSTVLGVATAAYAPYAIFCWLSPLTTMLFGYLNIKIKKVSKEEKEKIQSEGVMQ